MEHDLTIDHMIVLAETASGGREFNIPVLPIPEHLRRVQHGSEGDLYADLMTWHHGGSCDLYKMRCGRWALLNARERLAELLRVLETWRGSK